MQVCNHYPMDMQRIHASSKGCHTRDMLEEKGYDEASFSSSIHSVTRPQHELPIDVTSLLFPQWPCHFGQDVNDDNYLALETPFLWAYLE